MFRELKANVAEFVENTTVSDLVEVLEEEQVLDRLNCAILWVQITHAHERVGSVYVCVAGRRARGGPEERGCCVWGLLALHQSAAMSTNLDPSGRSIARDKRKVDCWSKPTS